MRVPVATLRHTIASGETHVDLLVAPRPAVGDDEREVWCWRCPRSPRDLQPGQSLRLRRIEDHRGSYLRLDSVHELGGDRGTVVPLDRGRAEVAIDEGRVGLDVDWDRGERQRLTLSAAGDGWRVTCDETPRTPQRTPQSADSASEHRREADP